MDITQFVTPELVDLTNCEQEAIHTPGLIQPHGLLLTLQEPDLIILQASQNTANFLGISAESLINHSLALLLNQAQLNQLQEYLLSENIEIYNPLNLSIKTADSTKNFECIIHRYDGVLILEMEEDSVKDKSSSLSFYHLVKTAIMNIKRSNNFQKMTELLTQEVRKITGYDRVMIYQFEPDESGIVIAEDKREGLEPFLGLHYPASDIPRKARQLYYTNWLRLIVDINYQPVPIIPKNNPLTNAPLNLSLSVLRSVSPIHIEYLQNMGVGASLCISLITDRKLWGLIVCHHYSPRYVTYEIRKFCELLGEVMSLEILNKQQQEFEKISKKIKLIQEELKENLLNQNVNNNTFDTKEKFLLELVNAEGAIIYFSKNLTLVGKTPGIEDIKALINWLQNHSQQEVFHTNCLSQIYPSAKQIKELVSGLLAISIFVNDISYQIIWLRPEVIQTVNWGGDPNKAVIIQDDGIIRLSPRRSFELWKETVREKSLPWKQTEINAAVELRNVLMFAVLKLYQSALQQAAIEAQAANRAKSQFLAKMSHELRTPLNAILGFTQVLALHSLDAEQQEYLGIIGRSGEHLLSLINDVLEMSKIEAGLVTFNENSFDLYHLLDGLEEMLQLKAESKNLQLLFYREPDLPQYVKTDESKLRQILINLLANAIKFTQKGTVILRVKVSESPRQVDLENSIMKCKILFEVEDTGVGIDPEEVKHLFEPFFQSEAGKKSMEGTGLGLPISRQFVQLMGGDISITSQLSKGTKVRFDVNVNIGITSDRQSEDKIGKVIALAPEQPIYRILVVEDNQENCQLLHKVLTSVGFEVRIATNGKEAIDLFISWQPHLIWMDVRMPVMDGLEATKKIKEICQESQSYTPKIIALTASAFTEDRDRILKAGFDDFVSKPFRISEIFAKMSHHLGVRYLYEEPTPTQETQKSQSSLKLVQKLTEADLSIMSAEWLALLNHAAICADDEQILKLIAEIPPEKAELADKLTDLVNNFDFEEITHLTRQ
ncbi:response regulator [Phormidium sp. LEGE 05292]|uniref:ATP-binding protein n=1 Tax=[Phormidium] sp. LEGE 05292 TaxID=767427 RepID=UPI00187F172C|nr:ATP-binding protein [Phormidium sp. LEGE 05292]MBE9224850.1 response regulator [Phormidium sp. LEGE 05292]